jgi:hypothetical protein
MAIEMAIVPLVKASQRRRYGTGSIYWTKISIVALSTFAIWLLVSFLVFRDRFAILLPTGVIVSAVAAYSVTNRFPGYPTSPPSERNL